MAFLNTTARFAAAIGKGLVAGFAGTAAMTLSSTLEAKLRDRGSSSTPADAAEKVLAIDDFTDEEAEARFGNLVHWGYGTGWGAVRGVLGQALPSPALATGAHLAAVMSAEQVMLPALEVAPPATEWGAAEIAVDGFHHAVYALATGAVYELLDRRS